MIGYYFKIFRKKAMRKISILFLSMLFLILADAKAQGIAPIYNTIIKGGRVIDAKNNINDLLDVAIKNGKIAKVSKNIDPSLGEQIVK